MVGEAAAQAPAKAAAPPAPRPTPAKPAAAGPATVEEVTVTGAGPEVRTSIDRRSYDIGRDLQSTSGSIGDALRNAPSVEVDVQGNISLRGDANVTIMIDGKPSAMFRGDGRAAALQQLPADQFERVEVITNPSAADRPDGSGGVINLISKQTRRAGWAGSVRANYGDAGRMNAGVTGAYNSQKMTFSGDLSARRERPKISSRETREVTDPVTGAVRPSRLAFDSPAEPRIFSGRLALDYDPDKNTRFGGELRRQQFKVRQNGYQHFEGFDQTGNLIQLFDRLSNVDGDQSFTEGGLSFRRKLSGDGHEITAQANREQNTMAFDRAQTAFDRLPALPDSVQNYRTRNRSRETELKVDYTRPMPGEGKLKTGYLLEIDNNDYDNSATRGLVGGPLTVDPSFTNLFRYDQTLNAAYATYEQPFGDVTVLAGLRLEQVDIEIDQITSNIQATNDYFRAYPSLHLTYTLSDEKRLSASYSRRVQRPSPFDLNPYRVYMDPLNQREGNPNLEPQETDSFEFGYQRRKAGSLLMATLFYRQSTGAVTDVVRDLGGGVFLTTKANLGETRSGGLELVLNGRLSRKITYNLNGTAFWTELDASTLGFTRTRSGVSTTGRANLNWQLTPKDFIQVNGFMIGERLTPQGYRKPAGMLNIGYSHKYSDQISIVFTAQDVLGTFKDVQVIDTPFRSRVERNFSQRGVFVGFTYAFGGQGQRPRDPGFDFGSGGAPPS